MYSTIVVGTDGSDTARTAVSTAAEMARTLGASLHLVTAYRARSGSQAVPMAGAAAADSGVGGAVSQKLAEEMLTALAAELGEVVGGTHVSAGDPADVVVAYATSSGADLIVVGSRGMHRRVLGSVPNSVAHQASCDVLVVKTD